MISRIYRGAVNSRWLIIAAVGFFVLCWGMVAQAQTDTNHPPMITSEPEIELTTDELFRYEITATDRNDDTLVYSLTTAPDEAIIANNIVSWQPTEPGTYNFVIEVTDDQAGFDTQAWQVTVATGQTASIVITPNDRPTLVPIGSSQQFSARLYDAYNNPITDINPVWTTDPITGTITDNGLFFAKTGGIGYVAATAENITTSIGVIVKDIRSELVTETQADEPTADEAAEQTDAPTEQTAPVENTAPEQEQDEGDVMGEETIAETGTEEAATEENDEAAACTNWAHWAIITILAVYGLALIVFFRYEKKNRAGSWWIFPTLLTVIGLILYYKYFCPETYLWWPWVLVGIGVVVTIFFKGRPNNPTDEIDDSQNELPL